MLNRIMTAGSNLKHAKITAWIASEEYPLNVPQFAAICWRLNADKPG
jgi:hypothetical protein